jgi:hypothetical protein
MGDAVIYTARVGRQPNAHQVLGSATKSGYLDKKNNSWLAYIFPWFFKRYKKRYFILAGGYLYRFTSESGDKPKGIPIPLSSCEVRRLEEAAVLFEVRTLRKRYTLRASSPAEVNDWVNSINVRKFDSIREEMGHTQVTDGAKMLNSAAQKLYLDKINAESIAGGDVAGTMNPMI